MMDLSKNRALSTNNPNKTNNGLEHAHSSVEQFAAEDEQHSFKKAAKPLATQHSYSLHTSYQRLSDPSMTYMPETTPTISPEVSCFCSKEHWTPLYVKGGEQGLPVHPPNTPVGSLEIASFKL